MVRTMSLPPTVNEPVDTPRTPPPLTAVIPNTLDTPVHHRANSYAPYSSINGMYQQPAYTYAAGELKGKYAFTAPEYFLNKHFPDPPLPTPQLNKNALAAIASNRNEKDIYAPLVRH